MAQRDIIGVAETGSGKTASFVIPMLSFISQLPPIDYNNSHLGPYGLVLAPVRELALQIEAETKRFCEGMGLICVSIVGGHSYTSQSNNLIQGAHILIATPGRLVDFVDRQVLALSQCYYVVLDEADRMVDLGFEEPLQKILDSMPASNLKPDTDLAEDTTWLRQNLKNPYRQTVMFSATMPNAVEKLAKQYILLSRYLRRPIQVIVGQVGQVVDRIEQRVEFIEDENQKLTRLGQVLKSREFEAPMIVFVNMKKNCEFVSRYLDKNGFRCVSLHGGKSQDAREFALQSLKDGKKDVLIATDVAGRGIDVKNVSLVVNFDMAKNIQDYTHRIGRTGRAGKKGTAITFWGNHDKEVLYDLKMILQKSPNSTVPPELARHEAALAKPNTTSDGGGSFKRK
jgi:ATP-dependent RNA helicase DDX23/PRP28